MDICSPLMAALPGAFTLLALSSLSAQEPTADLIAAQIRAQGYRCETPVSTEKDPKRSKPDAAVWVLKCKSDTYRVSLVPDMAAHVERLD